MLSSTINMPTPLNSAILVVILGLTLASRPIEASNGDRSPFFRNCVQQCQASNCTDNSVFISFTLDDLVFRKTLNAAIYGFFDWSCSDNCAYDCMWPTVELFEQNGRPVPQFYGKWPFVRQLNMQEPASVVFSIMNFVANWWGIKSFRQNVEPDNPMFHVWNAFSMICLNGWIWSTIFHCRDFPITELLDYTFAYSMVLASFTCMVLRMLHAQPKQLKWCVIVCSCLFFIYHWSVLSVGRFDYAYNMRVNVVTGMMGSTGWVVWFFCQPIPWMYAWKICALQMLATAALMLELCDFAPVWWTFDAHAIWHLMTVPLTMLLYSFLIDDCIALRFRAHKKEAKRMI